MTWPSPKRDLAVDQAVQPAHGRRDRLVAGTRARDNDDTSFRWHLAPNGRLIFGGTAIVTYFTRC
jgi:hypothetical protein